MFGLHRCAVPSDPVPQHQGKFDAGKACADDGDRRLRGSSHDLSQPLVENDRLVLSIDRVRQLGSGHSRAAHRAAGGHHEPRVENGVARAESDPSMGNVHGRDIPGHEFDANCL